MNPLTISFKADSLIPMTTTPAAQLASVLAHEVRNPLTNINLAVEIMGKNLKEEERALYLDIIRRSSVRINELLNDLLKQQEHEELVTAEHSIQELLDEVLEMARDRILLKNIGVMKSYDRRDWKILLNRPKMKIALTNIIVNAIDAMTTQKGQLKFVARSMGPKYLIRIEDNGCGISPDNLKNIFKPYYTNKPGGLGLGLSATYEILRSNHVGVHVESGLGKGTCFALSFDKHPVVYPFE